MARRLLALPAAGLGLGLGLGLWLGARRRGVEPRAGVLVVPAVEAASLPAPGRAELAKYGLPGLAQLRSRESYALAYDPRGRGALWVLERLDSEELRGPAARAACAFREDEAVHEYHRATNADYRGSGFQRGHLAAAANHRRSQAAMEDTFYLSNVAPQVRATPPAPRVAVARLARPGGRRTRQPRSCCCCCPTLQPAALAGCRRLAHAAADISRAPCSGLPGPSSGSDSSW